MNTEITLQEHVNLKGMTLEQVIDFLDFTDLVLVTDPYHTWAQCPGCMRKCRISNQYMADREVFGRVPHDYQNCPKVAERVARYNSPSVTK